MTNLKTLIASPFYQVHNCIKSDKYTHYWLKGGRGSTKSSFVSIEIILGIMKDPNANALVLRKVGETLKDSVYEQLEWAIKALGADNLWRGKLSPLELIYIPTGQRVIFRGSDKPKKIKSTKFKRGYCKFLWYEEVDEFKGIEEIRIINQSLMRGGESFCVFYSYNPPKNANNWVNKEVLEVNDDKLTHHSTYLDVPKEWLGERFIIEARHLEKIKPDNYRHEYMGEVIGTGGMVFKNVETRKITDEEIEDFDKINRGLDWGYTTDPIHYTVNHFDAKKGRLYIFYEFSQIEMSNKKAAEAIKTENKNNNLVACDSAEPKSIAEICSYGVKAIGVKKGPDSVDYGIKFLQDLESIVIDPERCPATAKEFTEYELISDGNDGFIPKFPDKNNHSIDATRYSLIFAKRDKPEKKKETANFKVEKPKQNPIKGSKTII